MVSRPSLALVFCVACASAPKPIAPAPTPSASSSAAPLVANTNVAMIGSVLDHSGKRAPAVAHIHVHTLSDKVVFEGTADVGGKILIPRVDAMKSEEVLEVDITAPDHARRSLVIAVSEAPVHLDIQLGTYEMLSDLSEVLIQVDGSSRNTIAMTKGGDGKFSTTVTAPDGEHRYQIFNSAKNRGVNGTTLGSFVYDGDGDYASTFRVTGGNAVIEFDPAKRPPSNARARLAFGKKSNASAALTAIADELDASMEKTQEEAMELMKSKGDPRAVFDKNRTALYESLVATASAATDPLVRNYAWINAFGLREEPKPERQKAAEALLAAVPPESSLWAASAFAFGNVIRTAGGDRSVMKQKFVEQQASDEAVAALLVEDLRAAQDDLPRARAIVGLLNAPRFAKLASVRAGMFLDPDRKNAPGRPVAPFEVKRLNANGVDAAKTFTVSSFKGDLLLIDVWASWCAPCIAEMPAMHDLYAKWGTRKGKKLRILSISVDDEPTAALKVRKTFPMPWDHGFAGKEERAIREALGWVGIPFYLLIDEKGLVIASGPPVRPKFVNALLAEILK